MKHSDPLLDDLKRYPVSLGYDREALRSMIQDANWYKPNCESVLRKKLRRIAKSALSAWHQKASYYGKSRLTFVRNLLACSKRRDLGVYATLLTYEAQQVESSLGEELRPILELIQSSDPCLTILERFILTDRRVPLGNYRHYFREKPSQLFCIQFFRALGSRPARGEELAIAYTKACVGIVTRYPTTCITEILKLSKDKQYPPFVDLELIQRFSEELRRHLFAASDLHVGSLRTQLKLDPCFHPDTPESIHRDQFLKKALYEISTGNFARDAFGYLIQDINLFEQHSEDIRQAIGKQGWRQIDGYTGLREFKKQLAQLPSSPVSLALRLLLSSVNDRNRLLAKESDTLDSEIFSILSNEFIAGWLSSDQPIRYRKYLMEKLSDQDRLEVVLRTIYQRLRSLNQTYRDYNPVGSSGLEHKEVLREWLRIASLEEINRTLSQNISKGIIFYAEVTENVAKFVKILNSHLKKIEPTTLGHLLLSKHIKRFRKLDSKEAERLESILQSRLMRPIVLKKWLTEKNAPRVIKKFPQHALEVIRVCPDAKIFAAVCATRTVWGNALLADGLLIVRDRTGWKLWPAGIKHLISQKKPIPIKLRAAIEADPKFFRHALKEAPMSFWESAKKRYQLRTLLPLAFENPKLGVDLERNYSRKKLRAQIPWIRRYWQDKPALSAAYEVASAFSLADAGYLVSLAKKLRPPFNVSTRGQFFDPLYRTYLLPKKSGGNRVITVPCHPLKRLQRRILDHGFDEILLHPAATGFRRGISIKDNALVHSGQKLVVNVDIQQFFPNTSYRLILNACHTLCNGKLSARAARLVTEICSFNGALPTGAPTSPAIANIALAGVDLAVGKVSNRLGINYTRYADDLTFSGDNKAITIIPFVQQVLAQQGYTLDSKKTNIYRCGRRQLVTGLVVNNEVNMPRKIRRKLRAAVHHRMRGQVARWHGQEITDNVLLGHIAFLALTQPDEARRYRDALKGQKTRL
jgi:retron-type reverse transcriptase